MSFELFSPAFDHNTPIPKQHSGEGQDISPPLKWQDAPPGTQSYALICDDPDAPGGPWVHWLIWNIPGNLTALPEGIAKDKTPSEPEGARQGTTSWTDGRIGYYGPMPPPGHGTHHYHFTLHALNQNLDLAPGASKKDLINAIAGHEIGVAKVVGTYER